MPRPGPAAARLLNAEAKLHNRAMFDWNDLKYFLAVARHGSTIAAAKALGLSQSTIHRRLEELQKRLGARLVTRQPAGYRLTELGKDLLDYAERVEDTAVAFHRRLAASETEPTGTVRVTCPEALGSRLMRSGLIEKFNARYPKLRVEFVMSDKVVDLAKGEADVAFRATVPSDPTLFGRKISPSPWAVYASKTYVARHGGIDGIEDIDRHAVVRYDGALRLHPAARWLQKVAPNAPAAARGAGLPAILMAAKSGAGVAVMPVIVGDQEADLVQLFGPIPDLPSDIYLLMHEDMKGTPRVRAFFDFVISELAALRPILNPGARPAKRKAARKGRPSKRRKSARVRA
jgi:DNA-binding transcriptional LysR family regulator